MSGRVVVVTGASAGVGRATARAFAGTVTTWPCSPVARTASKGPDGGGARGRRAWTGLSDVADAGAVDDGAARIEAELGPIDVWVNNAMASVFAPVTRLTRRQVRRVTEVTYLGAVHGTQSRAPSRCCRAIAATIVQVGSTLAYRAIPLQAPYCAAKHAVQGFTIAPTSSFATTGRASE